MPLDCRKSAGKHSHMGVLTFLPSGFNPPPNATVH